MKTISDFTEGPYYVQTNERLAAPLVEKPFTQDFIGVLMRQGDEELLTRVNSIIESCKKNGTLKALHEKYGFKYNF